MKVLVSGATGTTGPEVARQLHAAGRAARAFRRRAADHREAFGR